MLPLLSRPARGAAMAEVAVAGGGIGASAPRRLRPLKALAAEDDRRALWLPVFFGTGIALYFTLTSEPPIWAGFAATVPLALAVLALRRYPGWRAVAIALAFVAAGFAVMQEARWTQGAPMLQRRLGPVPVTGRVADIDEL